MTHGSLFSGIGGFDLAAQWMGWENLFHCEWNEFGQKVLNHYWPNAELFTDITKSDFTKYANRIDVLSGGFPCQPYSHAGKRLGKEDERHLWPEMLRAIREIQPTWVVGENVSGLISWNGGLVFHEVQTDLEAEGYEVFPVVLPACAVNAPHRRDRVWFIAYRDKCTKRTPRTCGIIESNRSKNNEQPGSRRQPPKQHIGCNEFLRPTTNPKGKQSERMRPEQREFSEQEQREFGKNGSGMGNGDAANTLRIGQPGKEYREKESGQYCKYGIPNGWDNFPTQPPVCSRNDGVPARLDGITFPKWRNESIKAYGNAIVPQVAFQIFKAIHSLTLTFSIQTPPTPTM